MAEVDHVQVTGFVGLNTNAPKDQIEDNELEVAENVVIRRGAIQKRKGATLRQDLSGEAVIFHPVGMVQSDQPSIVDLYLHEIEAGGNLYVTDSYVPNQVSLILIDGSVKRVLSNIIGTGAGAYCVVQRPDNTVELIRLLPLVPSSTVVSTNLVGEDTKHCWVLEHQDRLWVILCSRIVGGDFDGTVIGFSDPGDYSTISTLDTEEKTVRIPNAVMYEAQSLGDKILFFGKTGGIWALITQGTPRNWSLRQIDSEINIPMCRTQGDSFAGDVRYGFNQATLKYKNLIYFLAMDGFYVTDGVTIQRLSDKVQNHFSVPFEVTFAGTFGDGDQLTEFCGVQVFDDMHDELIIKLVYDTDRPPIYFIYSIRESSWTEFKFGLDAPLTAPTKSAPILGLIDADALPYPYSFESMLYCFKTRSVGGADLVPGLHLFSNYLLTEKNKCYNVRANARPEDSYAYYDGTSPVADGTPYISRIKSKSFDFGFKGINKKSLKTFFTLRRVQDIATLLPEVPYTVDLVVRKYVNDIVMADVDLAIDHSKRHIKIAGPGYFIEYALEILDEDNVGFWELQSMSFDLIKKPEQLSSVGVSP